MRALLLAALLSGALGCAGPRGYFLEESTGRIYTRDSLGRVTKRYEPGTREYDEIALRFWPHLLEAPVRPEGEPEGRRAELNRFMKGLDKDQWHILLDMEMWTGNDRIDLQHLEDLQEMAAAVKGLRYGQYLELKERYPIRTELRAKLLKGER